MLLFLAKKKSDTSARILKLKLDIGKENIAVRTQMRNLQQRVQNKNYVDHLDQFL